MRLICSWMIFYEIALLFRYFVHTISTVLSILKINNDSFFTQFSGLLLCFYLSVHVAVAKE